MNYQSIQRQALPPLGISRRVAQRNQRMGDQPAIEIERLADFPPHNWSPALLKAFLTVVYLRSLARQLVAQNPDDDISEYSIALFYNAINTLRVYSLPVSQREHALLCASLLADRLGLKG